MGIPEGGEKQIFTSHISGGWKSRIKHKLEGIRKLCGASIGRIQTPIMRVLPSGPNHFLKAPSPNTNTFRIRISTYEFMGNMNIQTVTAHLYFCSCPTVPGYFLSSLFFFFNFYRFLLKYSQARRFFLRLYLVY